MTWARIRSFLGSLPGGGEPPVLEVTSDENGDAVIELAWDPAALMAPASYPASEALRYYSTNINFNATLIKDNGATMTLNVPAQRIQLTGGRATWVMPQNLWDAYVEETFKTLRSPSTTTFVRSIYYRVRVTPPGGSQAVLYPTDATLQNLSSVPTWLQSRISILTISGDAVAQVVPDMAAVEAMGGIALFPNLWKSVLLMFWKALPLNDPNRGSLAAIFAHPNFQSIADVNIRGKILKLWLFAGATARPRLAQLLDRQTAIGSNITTTIILKQDLRGGKTLVENLLSLLDINPHPDFVTLTSKEQLLDNVITEILDPNGQINQGSANTCSPTSIQTLLITVNPSEYVRLQLGLLSPTGATQLANGSSISIPPGIFQLFRYPNPAGQPFIVRTYAELAFQSTILKYARGGAFPAYDPSAAANAANGINTVFQASVNHGLAADETKRALDGIFNVNFTKHYIPLTSQADEQAAQPGIHTDFLSTLPAKQQQMILAMFWSQPYNFGHAVLAVRRDNGRIFFKNPQYPGSHPPAAIGTTATNPPRRYDDPSAALESIAESDLLTWIKGYWVPDVAIL
ncbi:hypothetical protein C7B65_19610 [Phormidesmis priestleyi ULC007]|uniref:Uncharacterized protein n=1 Tax=Phormidesmis priestleyi ULC007 TaxID=1920490 RepID=A0A2T1D9D1_9CYAN|nr:hypothetical protein [Phormidesmis priestleyi]PSB17119.1 hypothetical protein C7B65_19610 [Phormidesmis priestleyi ULC007]PZO47473.1 MAG: hypothetical protein DCF14_19815 [Phormidesmis priestleyi]